MVAEVLLHIGMHKTGTTALQQALAGYDTGGTRFAQLGHRNHSIPFATCFISEPHRYHVWKRIAATPERVAAERARMQDRLTAELGLDRARLLVIGEEISLLATQAVTTMADHLRADGRHVSILAYLRDPLGYVTSAFQQQVRGGQSCYTLPRPYYRQRFEKFLSIFGHRNVTFRAYRPKQFPDQSIVSDFAAAIGLPTKILTDCRANLSLPLDAVRLVHLFNRTGPACRTLSEFNARSAMIAHIAASSSTRFHLSPEIAASVVDPDEVAWATDVTGIPLGHLPRPADPAAATTALTDFLRAISAEAIDRLRSDLSEQGLATNAQEDPASLLAKLFDGFLAREDAARLARQSASA